MRISDWSSDVCSSDLPEKTRQPLDHRIGVVGAAVEDQRRYRVETVEQEMRIDLVMERLKLGRLRHRAQLRRTPPLRARLEPLLHGEIATDPPAKKQIPRNTREHTRAAAERQRDRPPPRQ